MEGRAIARPNYEVVDSFTGEVVPSMEGRAIARPNSVSHVDSPLLGITFNGGPGNCPAKPDGLVADIADATNLQWRAGQLPGQTPTSTSTLIVSLVLQWRAGQLPGQTTRVADTAIPMSSLQWRAGQLPGQTGSPYLEAPAHLEPSMEGRAIARPNAAAPK